MFKITSQLKLYEEKISDEDMLEQYTPLFMQIMSSCRHNIEKKFLKNILNLYLVFSWMKKITSY